MTKRFQLDLTEQEHNEMERLMDRAGIKTKREFVTNALTLFKWAANETANGRQIASMDLDGGAIKQLEMPALQAFARIAEEFDRLRPSDEEVRRRSNRPGLPLAAVLAEIRRLLAEAEDLGSHDAPA